MAQCPTGMVVEVRDGHPMCISTPVSNAIDTVRSYWSLGLITAVPAAGAYAMARRGRSKHVAAWTVGGAALGVVASWLVLAMSFRK